MARLLRKPRRGLTLFQLLVVLALLALLFALLLPAVFKVRMAAARTKSANNLKQICLATINCADTNNGRLPPAAGDYPGRGNVPNNGFGPLFFHILPYLEQDNLYKNSLGAIDNTPRYLVWHNKTCGQHIPTYEDPEDPSQPPGELFHGWLATGSYATNFLVFGKVDPNYDPVDLQGESRFPASITDGTSNTIFFGQRYRKCGSDANAWGYWAAYSWLPTFAYASKARFQVQPTQENCDPRRAQSPHTGGFPAGMGDGSVRNLTPQISDQTWWHACTPNGGEVLGPDF
jgi:type II secretory pathway pseudopilin PulG